MFNENINDLKNVVPSLGVMKLYKMLIDVYKRGERRYNLNPLEMMKILIALGDKYKLIDKIILLCFGVVKIEDVSVSEEILPISRFKESSLSEDEKKLLQNENEDERPAGLAAPVSILKTNIGTVIIGYDYAYVNKPEYTPNVVLTEEEEKIKNDVDINTDINYPYIKVDGDNNNLLLYPVYKYSDYVEKKQKHENEYFTIDVEHLILKDIYLTNPIKYEDDKERYILKTIDEVDKNTLPNIPGYSFKYTLIKRDKNNKSKLIKHILHYENENGQVLQFINDLNYAIHTIYLNPADNKYYKEKTYLANVKQMIEDNKEISKVEYNDEDYIEE